MTRVSHGQLVARLRKAEMALSAAINAPGVVLSDEYLAAAPVAALAAEVEAARAAVSLSAAMAGQDAGWTGGPAA